MHLIQNPTRKHHPYYMHRPSGGVSGCASKRRPRSWRAMGFGRGFCVGMCRDSYRYLRYCNEISAIPCISPYPNPNQEAAAELRAAGRSADVAATDRNEAARCAELAELWCCGPIPRATAPHPGLEGCLRARLSSDADELHERAGPSRMCTWR